MRLKNSSFAEFARRVRETGKQIIVYGAGVIGQASAPYWLHEYDLEPSVFCYVDADPCKQKRVVSLGDRQVPIRPLTVLEEEAGRCFLLITVSAFVPVVQALERLRGMEDTEAYFLPVMLLNMAHAPKREQVVKTSREPLIPKKIHYCWFSGAPVPQPLRRCIDTWKRFCPDYEIIRWDERNYDVSAIPYMDQAYRHQKWSFVSDAARLDIIFRHGGIYLDTDVELVKCLDELLYQPAFCATEKWGIVNSGGGLGAEPGNPVVRRMLEFRRKFPFACEDGRLNLMPSGYYETVSLLHAGLRPNGRTQLISDGGMTVYSPAFFHPFDYVSGETNLTENTVSIHHFSGTWLGPDAAEERAKTKQQYQDFVSRLEA